MFEGGKNTSCKHPRGGHHHSEKRLSLLKVDPNAQESDLPVCVEGRGEVYQELPRRVARLLLLSNDDEFEPSTARHEMVEPCEKRLGCVSGVIPISCEDIKDHPQCRDSWHQVCDSD